MEILGPTQALSRPQSEPVFSPSLHFAPQESSRCQGRRYREWPKTAPSLTSRLAPQSCSPPVSEANSRRMLGGEIERKARALALGASVTPFRSLFLLVH